MSDGKDDLHFSLGETVNPDAILEQVLKENKALGRVHNIDDTKVIFASPERTAGQNKYNGGGGIEYWPREESGLPAHPHPNGGKTKVLEVFSDELKNNPELLKKAVYGDLLHGMTKADPYWAQMRTEFANSFTPEEKARINAKRSWWEDANGEGGGMGALPTIDAYMRGYLNENDVAMQGQKQFGGTMYSPRQIEILNNLGNYIKTGETNNQPKGWSI